MQQRSKTRLSVADFMSSPPVMVNPETSFSDAIRLMAVKKIGNLVIAEDASGIGLVTEREIIQYLALNKTIPDKKVKYMSTRKFVPIIPSTSILSAARTMITKSTRLLVFKRDAGTRTDKLTGIITASDIMRAFLETERNPSLDAVMSRKLVTLNPSSSILNGVKTMLKRRIGSLIVSDKGGRYGIFTERDLIGRVLQNKVDIEENIGGYTSFPLVTAKLGIRARDAGKLMFAHMIKRLPLTENGRLVSIVTARDVVEAFQRRR